MPLLDRLIDEIRSRGPLTVAAFMERALYDPDAGYYATAGQRSGRHGDFYTSVDAGPLFGEVLAELVSRTWAQSRPECFDLVEAGAGNGRLMRDLLNALRARHDACYRSLRVVLVERSAVARRAHAALAADHQPTPVVSSEALPDRIDGLLLANELLDAMPVHRLVQTQHGLREAYVREDDGRLGLVLGPVSSGAVASYLDAAGVTLQEGGMADVSPEAVAWTRDAARRLRRGGLLLIDYGQDAATLFGDMRPEGTLASYARHQIDLAGPGAGTPRHPSWLEAPGTRDLTAHVDFTSVTRAAEREGARRDWLIEQRQLLLRLGLSERLSRTDGAGLGDIRWRLAAKTLVNPHGLGATHRALLLSKGLDGAALLDPEDPVPPLPPRPPRGATRG
jgi:SAM-dependent MidA family methyltransferase